jgi:hypothetical protein
MSENIYTEFLVNMDKHFKRGDKILTKYFNKIKYGKNKRRKTKNYKTE